ncbi:hypothetical protein Hanom_Chr07g00671721 [Helianthus anomalus]
MEILKADRPIDNNSTEILSARWASSQKLESLSLLHRESPPQLLPFSKKSLTIAAKSCSLSWLKDPPNILPPTPPPPPPPPDPPPPIINHGSPVSGYTLQSILHQFQSFFYKVYKF